MLQNYTATLSVKQPLTKTVYRFEFSLPKSQTLIFTPGQYLLLEINGLYRQYSLSNSPSQKQSLETFIDLKPMGPGSLYLQSLKVGDKVNFRAPLGLFTLKPTQKPKYFLATGVGISPIKAMILDLYEKSFASPFQLFWGLASKQDLYLQDLWLKISQENSFFQYTYCLSKEILSKNNCFNGHVQMALASVKLVPESEFYLCGRPTTVSVLQEFLLTKLKVLPQFIFHENFT